MHVLLTRTRHGFVPADEQAQDELAKVKIGSAVLCDVKRARNPNQHRLMFAILHRMFENQREPVRYSTWDGFYVAIKYALGWYDDVPVKDGLETNSNGDTTIPVLWSLEFAQLPQEKFEPMLEQVLDLAARVGISVADLQAAVRV